MIELWLLGAAFGGFLVGVISKVGGNLHADVMASAKFDAAQEKLRRAHEIMDAANVKLDRANQRYDEINARTEGGVGE